MKHYFLENYLGRLLHKTASRYDKIVYVDGFSGPWQNSGEQFEDTSFGIALQELRKAKASAKATFHRDIEVSAFLVEKRADAHARLLRLGERFPDIRIFPYHGNFVDHVDQLLADIPPEAFAFVFIDPKGWRIPVQEIAPLLRRPNMEIVFNFMFEFINRAAAMAEPVTVEGIDELIPLGDWRERLAALGAALPRDQLPTARKEILVEAFKSVIGTLGSFDFVMDTPVLRPLKNRMLYSLVYATRKPIGVEVFRDCQVKTLREQESVRGVAKVANATAGTGQGEMFGSMVEMAPDETARLLDSELHNAEQLFVALTPHHPLSISYDEIWPRVLVQHAIRKTDLNRIAGNLKRDGQLIFPEWAQGKRVPDGGYRMYRPHQAATAA